MKLHPITRAIRDDLIAIRATIEIMGVVESESRIVARFYRRVCDNLLRP